MLQGKGLCLMFCRFERINTGSYDAERPKLLRRNGLGGGADPPSPPGYVVTFPPYFPTLKLRVLSERKRTPFPSHYTHCFFPVYLLESEHQHRNVAV